MTIATGRRLVLTAGLVALNACGATEDSGAGSSLDGGAEGSIHVDGGGLSDSSEGGATVDGGCKGGTCPVSCPPGVKTTVRGTVRDPAGRLPLSDVRVYVPPGPLPAIVSGVGCDRCAPVAGALASTRSDTQGNFVLELATAGTDVPVVFQVGKWRREIVLPTVAPCVDNPITDSSLTRLPRNKAEGNIPLIAVSTGGADSFECLLRKVGVDDSEFTTRAGNGRVHLFAGSGTASETATSAFSQALGGATFPPAPAALWGDPTALNSYDLVLLSCEGNRNEATKPPNARVAMFDYANSGGRIVASHDQSLWLGERPGPFASSFGQWTERPNPPDPLSATVNGSFARGASLAAWSSGVGAGPNVSITEARHRLATVSPAGRAWVTFTNTNAPSALGVQIASADTPIGAPSSAICGRVVYASMHVSAADTSGPPFPDGCSSTMLTPQDKVMEFMLFEASACLE